MSTPTSSYLLPVLADLLNDSHSLTEHVAILQALIFQLDQLPVAYTGDHHDVDLLS